MCGGVYDTILKLPKPPLIFAQTQESSGRISYNHFKKHTTSVPFPKTPPFPIQIPSQFPNFAQFPMSLQLQVSSGIPATKFNGKVGFASPDVYCSFMIGKQRKESNLIVKKKVNNQKGLFCSSLETVGPVVGEVTEVDKDTFWPLVNAAGDKIVVLDMYTQWCGPCKIIAPKYQELSQTYSDVVFLKLDCNNENKSLAKELGIKVVPTFKIIKDSKVVKEVTGAKFDNLVAAIESVRSS